MQVPVIFVNGSSGVVSSEDLDDLVRKSVILAFRRSDGWVMVGVDEIRDPGGRSGSSWKDRKALARLRSLQRGSQG